MNSSSAELIRASAGTGKTYQLTLRLLSLLERGEKPGRILATTFTRKAAGEIRNRLFLQLAKTALDSSSEKSAQYRLLLHNLTQNQHQLKICTLDSFFVMLGRSFALELGLPVDWKIAEEGENSQLQDKSLTQALSQDDENVLSGLIQLLTSGKLSRSIYARIKSQINYLYDCYRLSKPQAWNWMELKEKQDQDLRSLIDKIQAIALPTTKSGQPVKKWQSAVADAVKALEEQSWKSFLEKGLAKKIIEGSKEFSQKVISEGVRCVYLDAVSYVKEEMRRDLRQRTLATYKFLELFSASYQANKALCGKLSFSDICCLLAKTMLLEQTQECYYRLDGEIAHLLLDEFQDTSVEQWKVLEPLAAELLSKADGSRSFFCVGDVKQAIYRWRGGKSEVFDHLSQKFSQLHESSMIKSWRSSEPVITLVNRVFERLAENPVLAQVQEENQALYHTAAKRWAFGFEAHCTVKKELAGYSALIQTRPGQGEANEAAVYRKLNQIVGQITAQTPQASIGILVRRNKTIPLVLSSLAACGIDASEEGGNSLTDSPAVLVVLSALKLADHPSDSISRFQLAQSQLGPLLDFSDYTSDASAARLSRRLRQMISDLNWGKTLAVLVDKFSPFLGSRDLQRCKRLLETAYAFDSSASLRSKDFIEYIKNKKVEDPSSCQVRVMTIHRAKGLEFDAVILPELDRPLLESSPKILTHSDDPMAQPSRIIQLPVKALRSLDKQLAAMYCEQRINEAKEALSLLYVALSRAVQACYLLLEPASKPDAPSGGISFSKVLVSALCSGAAQNTELLWECGDSLWYEHKEKISPEAHAAGSVLQEQPASAPVLAPAKRRRGLLREAPSELEGGSTRELGALFRPANRSAMLRGSLLHSLFQQVSWIEELSSEKDKLKNILQQRQSSSEDILLDEFFEMLSYPQTAYWLSRKAYPQGRVEVFTELPFALREGEGILSGSIDRLVIGYNSSGVSFADVLDYKTDRLPHLDRQSLVDKLEFYRPQLEAYRRVAAKMTGLSANQVSARLLFVSSGNMIELACIKA